MTQQSYKTQIDLRVLSEKLRFLLYVSGGNTPKKLCVEFTYDTKQPTESIYNVDKNGVERMFLIFKNKHLQAKTYVQALSLNDSDLILEVYKNGSGTFGFTQLSGRGFGAFLSDPHYFNLGSIGALRKFGEPIGHKQHAIQMVFPKATLRNSTIDGPSFDIDILSEKCNQYTHNLSFKLKADKDVVMVGDTLDIKPVKQIINEYKSVDLPTTYISLGQKELASKEVIFDYNKELKRQDCNWQNLTLIDSQVYAVNNTIKPLTNLAILNLPPTNVIEIPYNISREYYNNKIIESSSILKGGKEIYPLNWIKELQNNDIIQSAKKCISFSFTSREQLISFGEKLKTQQIGSIETYPVVNNEGQTTITKRTYSKISQWIERSTLNTFTDARFTYNVDGYISSILICPAKNSKIGPTKISTENNLYSDGSEYVLPGGKEYVGYYNVDSEKGALTTNPPKTEKPYTPHNRKPGANSVTPNTPLIALSTYAPISGFSSSDFCFSTYDIKNESGIYSGFTYSLKRNGTLIPTYDIHLSGASFSGKTSIPISNIERRKKLPLINDYSKMYTSYAFPQAYAENGGYVKLNNNKPLQYLEYTAKTSGVYRFTYEAYFNFNYYDTKWCEYLNISYPSGTTNNYPSSDYDIKRLINTSILQAGENETNTVLLDTNLKINPGIKYCAEGAERKFCSKEGFVNTGINEFKFVVNIVKTSTAGTGTNLASYCVGRSKTDGGCDEYLTLCVSNLDKNSSGFTSCVLPTVSASSIFTKQLPVKVDTGLINLTKGEKVILEYDTSWETISKRGGVSNIDINVGHKLGSSGQTTESPYYRGVKLSSASHVVSKNLFFDTSKTSLPFKMVQGNMPYTMTMEGTLYISDTSCGNIVKPNVTRNTFGNLNFVDTTGPQHRLVWDRDQNTPTNQWQRLIESNEIKDYIVEIGDKKSLTTLKDTGVFYFYLPTYNDEYGATCNYAFPSVSQSYIVQNKFKNINGKIIEHFIVVTPQCKFYKPCTAIKPKTVYDILHKSLPERRKLINYNRKLTINGKEITVVSNKSNASQRLTKLPSQVICRYYCSCGQPATSALDMLPGGMVGNANIPIDSIFGTTNIITDLGAGNCEECLQNATNYCSNLMSGLPGWMVGNVVTPQCEPFIVGDCEISNPSPEQTNLIHKKGERIIVTVTENNQVIASGAGGKPPESPEGGGSSGRPEGGPPFGGGTGGPPPPPVGGTGGPPPPPGGGAFAGGRYGPSSGVGGRPLGPTGPVGVVGGYLCDDTAGGCQHTTNQTLIVFTTLEDCRLFCVGPDDGGPRDPRGPGDEPVVSLNEALGLTEEELEEIKLKEPAKYNELVEDIDRQVEEYYAKPSEKAFCNTGYYWCESQGGCINLKSPCKE